MGYVHHGVFWKLTQHLIYIAWDLGKISVVKYVIQKFYFLTGWKYFFSQNEPTLTTLLGLKHTILDLGLDSLIAMLNDVRPGNSIDHKTGKH